MSTSSDQSGKPNPSGPKPSGKPNQAKKSDANSATQTLRGRRAARFAGVQALYQLEQDENLTPDLVMLQFAEHRFPKKRAPRENMDGVELDAVNKAYFSTLVSGTQTNEEDIDNMVTGQLPDSWTMARLDSVLRAILRAGAFELAYVDDVPARVAINEYVEIAKSFFNGKEPGMVNAVLDSLAQILRVEEFEAPA